MAVFDELNRHAERMEDPEARKAEKIERAPSTSARKRKGSSSVSLETYKRTTLFVNILGALVVVGIIGFGGYWAVTLFIG